MTDSQDIKIQEAQSEIGLLREALKRQMVKVADAETALSFYANPTNYKTEAARNSPDFVVVNVIQDDFSEADNTKKVLIAGKRAREYAQKHQVSSP